MSRSLCDHIRISPSKQSIDGLEYEAASGHTIPNVGERICEICAEGSESHRIKYFQMPGIINTFLSLSKAADMGFHRHRYKAGVWLEEEVTRQRVPVCRQGNVNIMQMWVKEIPRTYDVESGFKWHSRRTFR